MKNKYGYELTKVRVEFTSLGVGVDEFVSRIRDVRKWEFSHIALRYLSAILTSMEEMEEIWPCEQIFQESYRLWWTESVQYGLNGRFNMFSWRIPINGAGHIAEKGTFRYLFSFDLY